MTAVLALLLVLVGGVLLGAGITLLAVHLRQLAANRVLDAAAAARVRLYAAPPLQRRRPLPRGRR